MPLCTVCSHPQRQAIDAALLAQSGSATLVRSALGDAVCVDALAWLAERHLNPLLAETIVERIAASSNERITERSDQDE